ncbi:MAG TPA: APC family permease [Terriglobales bacterium]|nr:APC family permease [Terriglobales bacterium]
MSDSINRKQQPNSSSRANLARDGAGPELVRGIGLAEATTLNMIDMIGVGPFITLPLVIAAAGGPQAMLGWIFGALLALCDGLVWAELGAAMPAAGGSYFYLKEIYGAQSLGRLLSFLFIWQLSFSAPLSIASGCIGLAQYAEYLWPGLGRTLLAHTFHLVLPLIGTLEVSVLVMPATWLAIATAALVTILLYRRITVLGKLAELLWIGVALAVGWVIVAGLTHFSAARAFDFPRGAFAPSPAFFTGMGAAMLIATYDYWGYYNVCFLGGEVKDPGRTIPRALVFSIVAVAVLYLMMNVAVLGVIPWRELASHSGGEGNYVIAIFMQRIYGAWAGRMITGLIMWTALASVFSTLLGYSRVPYAAALDSNYFRAFARVDPKRRLPTVSLVALGGVAMLFCFLRLVDVIAALVVIRILLQFIVQAVGVMVLRERRPEMPRPFRMWLYPAPALLAIAGFMFILLARQNFLREIRYAAAILIAGSAIYLVRSWKRREWPFTGAERAIRPS